MVDVCNILRMDEFFTKNYPFTVTDQAVIVNRLQYKSIEQASNLVY